MKEVGPERYRALHLVGIDGSHPARRGVNPSSPIARLLASLVVSAHGRDDAAGPAMPSPASARGAVHDRRGARALITVDALRARWQRAIADDDAVLLGAMVADHPALGLAPMTAPDGKSALMVAAGADDLALAQALSEGGASIGSRTEAGATAMMFTALGEQVEVVQWLHEQGGELEDVFGGTGWTMLTIAAARGFAPMVDWLLDIGAVPDPVDVHGFTPLMRSVENGHLETTLHLLEVEGIAVDHADEYGNTALHHASAAARTDLVRALLSAGADAGRFNRAGYPPSALICGDVELTRLLAGSIGAAVH